MSAASPGLSNASSEQRMQLREEAYRANNLGVAHLEQFNHADAVKEFQRALSIDPGMKLAQVNLAIALFNAQDIDKSLRAALTAQKAAPHILQTHYLLGLIARNQNRTDDAIGHFRRVLESDPGDVGANVNLGQIYTQQRMYAEAIPVFRRAYDAEPYNSTAIYNLATALLRNEQREEGQRLIEKFQALRQSGASTSIGQNYLEQGRYAEALVSTGAEAELVDRTPPKIVFRPRNIGPAQARTPRTGERASGQTSNLSPTTVTLFDYDNDGDLDLLHTGAGAGARLFRNDSGRFIDVSGKAGDLARRAATRVFGVLAGDYDNDSFDDVLFFGEGPPRLLRGDGKGSFANAPLGAGIATFAGAYRSGAFVDADHDGDLDVFFGGWGRSAAAKAGGQNRLLRNNGDGTFADITAAAGVGGSSDVVAVVPTDFDNRRDVDILVVGAAGNPVLFQNLRNGAFRDAAREVGLPETDKWTSTAAGDFNKDTFVDFFFGRAGKRGVFAVSNGRGRFILLDAPEGSEGATAAQFIDHDNDGLLDLVFSNEKGFAVSRNLGAGWSPADTTPFGNAGDGIVAGAHKFASGDLDGDGDVDLVSTGSGGELRLWENIGPEANRSTVVNLRGRVSNRSGIGSKVDMRSGSLSQKLESYSASPMPAPSDIHFGLGRRERPDALRIIWPSGVVQAEVQFMPAAGTQAAAKALSIEELDRKPSSCPYLYTWNGEHFEFVTDFLGGGEMGNWKEHGAYHFPDSDEFVRIPPGKLSPRNGKYEIRVTNELEEVLFLDHLKLVAVEHDAESEVYPNEGLGIPTAGKRILYTTANEKPPLSATDDKGHNVLPKISNLDRTFYDSFTHLNIRGYARPHALTLDLDEKNGYTGRTLLLLTGWTDYAFSSDNLAASQSGKSLSFPKLQVRNKTGDWQTVIDSIGIAVGRPQTVVVDLTGRFLSESREVRIVTNVKTYWDKIAVDTSEQGETIARELAAEIADLGERGFSEEHSYSGMILPRYERVVNDSRWKFFSGSFTKMGDVNALLSRVDDVFVISKTGDELVLSFAEPPPPAAGRKYTFLLYADGYSKEMDINSGSPDVVLPLPFKGMTKYPYGTDERFPMTDERRRIYDTYTTRQNRKALPSMEAVFLK